MITKEEFVKLISKYQSWDKRIDEVTEILKICPLEMDWVEYGAILFNDTLHLLFTEEGVDWINWWLFEKFQPYNDKPLEAYNNENIIPTETIDDLWNIVKDYRK